MIRRITTLRGVPMIRRHVYFYILLFLTTAFLHNTFWKTEGSDVASAALQAGENAAAVQHELALAEQQFSP